MKTTLTNLSIALLCTLSSTAQQKIMHPNSGQSIAVYTTAENTNSKLTLTETVSFKPVVQPLETEVSVFVNPKKTFQTVVGIGGAITDASAEVFAKLPKEKQQEFLEAYYSKTKGIGYTLARTTIHSSDFSSGSYTYVAEGDKTLSTFSVSHDKQFRIPLIKQAMEKAGAPFVLYASPWSPPAFMKSNNNMLRGGKLLPEFYQSWANYYTKFVKSYQKEGILMWGLTVQNEPMATQKWESCIYTASEERDFLKNYLGPTMAKAGLSNVKIIVWDHNRDLLTERANTIFDDPEAAKYAWGVGFHWYENWSGGEMMFNNVKAVAESYPTKKLFFTEGCVEKFDTARYQYWPNAERYGVSMINDFNNGIVGWTDWNILLDENGGPNHVGNFCFSPIHADTKNGELIYTPSYYYIGHFSKFVQPNAKRVSAVPSRSSIMCTSFINKDGKAATIVLNKGNESIHYKLFVGNKQAEITIPAHAMQTLVY
ncbi:MAG: glycoside hydrolase family 30 protein [Bacteroidales bacterium]|nr:glycoside hydrolase family 30 protein [Bacteroidales bacterium]